jgi:hypothetical protein
VRSWLLIEEEGNRSCLRTSEALVARRRRNARILAALCALAGVALAALSPWFLALVALGLLGLAVAPRLFAPVELLEIDRSRDRLVPLQRSVGHGRPVAISGLRKVTGVYEVYGWDPRSTIYAVLANDERIALLAFPGTDEALAEEACRLLGRYLDSEATYAGPYGAPKTCFSPARSHESAIPVPRP